MKDNDLGLWCLSTQEFYRASAPERKYHHQRIVDGVYTLAAFSFSLEPYVTKQARVYERRFSRTTFTRREISDAADYVASYYEKDMLSSEGLKREKKHA